MVAKSGNSHQKSSHYSSRFANEKEVAAIIGITAKTLRKWRILGRGPKFRKLGGSIRYDLMELEKWIQSSPAGPATGGRKTQNTLPAA